MDASLTKQKRSSPISNFSDEEQRRIRVNEARPKQGYDLLSASV